MRIAYLAAGAGDMLCGSCLRDNRLAATLRDQGRDVILIPLYTPLRAIEEPATAGPVYYGGINVYLQQKSALFRHTPRWLDRTFDAAPLLRAAGRRAASTRAEKLGPLTVSILRGEQGAQRKELTRLVRHLGRLKPNLVHLPNLMFVGVAQRIKAELSVPVLCTLSGEDVFLDQLPEPHKSEAFALIRERAAHIDAFVAVTKYFARRAAEHFALPADRIRYVPMGIRVDDLGSPAAPPAMPFTIGYLARICPEKGLHVLCDAFLELHQAGRNCRLRVAGYLGPADRKYFSACRDHLCEHGAEEACDFLGEVTRAQKLEFLRSLHAFSVPAAFPEPKGFYMLEALASGVPVVQPRTGSCPEIVESTAGGILYEPNEARPLADAIRQLMDDDDHRTKFASDGRAAVLREYTAERMAAETWKIYESHV